MKKYLLILLKIPSGKTAGNLNARNILLLYSLADPVADHGEYRSLSIYWAFSFFTQDGMIFYIAHISAKWPSINLVSG